MGQHVEVEHRRLPVFDESLIEQLEARYFVSPGQKGLFGAIGSQTNKDGTSRNRFDPVRFQSSGSVRTDEYINRTVGVLNEIVVRRRVATLRAVVDKCTCMRIVAEN